jgi:hypothetical protein
MPVGPTIIHILPVSYMNATAKYSSQVKITDLPDGALTLTVYSGGIPFPQPDEPYKGWKIPANLWYRYTPHLTVNAEGLVCFIGSNNSVSCKAGMKFYRQLSYGTDTGVPNSFPQFEMVEEPERYTAVLANSHTDSTRPEEVYVFIPSLRHYQPLSPAARCNPDLGTDETPDDRCYGFDSNLTQLSVEFIGGKKILGLLDLTMPKGRFSESYDMPFNWPEPPWGKWQLRDAYQVAVSNLPSRSSGCCFARRVMGIDKATYAQVREDLFDIQMRPNHSIAFFLRTLDIPGICPHGFVELDDLCFLGHTN